MIAPQTPLTCAVLLLTGALLMLGCPAKSGSSEGPKIVPKAGAPANQDTTPAPVPAPVRNTELAELLAATVAYDPTAPLNTTILRPEERAEKRPPDDGSYILLDLVWQTPEGQATGYLTIPTHGASQHPLVVLLGGRGAWKGAMTRKYSALLARERIATLSVELPGAAIATPQDAWSDPAAVASLLARSVKAARRGLDVAASRGDVRLGKIGVIGVGLGAHIATFLAATDERVAAVVLQGLSDQPGIEGESAISWDPQLEPADQRPSAGLFAPPALPAEWALEEVLPLIAPRPLLFQHGRQNPLIDTAGTTRLIEAAGEPKTQRWYDTGAVLPAAALADAVSFLATHLGAPGDSPTPQSTG